MAQLQELIERDGEPALCECWRHYVGAKCAYTEQQRQAIAELRILLPPGTTLYTILRHVSKSGMVRDISVILLSPLWPGETRDISNTVATVLCEKRMDNG